MSSIGAAGWGSRHKSVSGEETGAHFGLTFQFFFNPNQGQKKRRKESLYFFSSDKREKKRAPHTFMVFTALAVVVVSGASVDNLVVGYVTLKAVHAVRRTGSCL